MPRKIVKGGVRVLTHKQLLAEAERVARDLVGVSRARAFVMLDRGELNGTLAAMYLSPLRTMLEPPRRKPRRRFRVGDRVRYTMGARKWVAWVVEDRGNLGRGGEQIVRLNGSPVADPENLSAFELSASLLTLISPVKRGRRAP